MIKPLHIFVAILPFIVCGCEPRGGKDNWSPPAQRTGAQSSDWKLIGGNDYEQHFSTHSEINSNNISDLKLEWYADIPTRDGLTGVPIVVDGVIYQSGGLGKAWAHDARTGEQLWEFDAQIEFPLGVVPSWGARLSRGLAVWEDKVLKASGDCRLFALNRFTGEKIWEVRSCDTNEGRTITGAPRVGDGKVFIGNADADSKAGRPHVDAYDIATGRHLWRFYTIPGDPALGFENKTMEMASKTWGESYWLNAGGGSVWEGITYDPRTDLVIIGTDGASPFDPRLRGNPTGDELFTAAIVALKADTGEYVWHYSTTPQDGWNYSSTMPIVLADLTMEGQQRAVVMNAPKNGFFYVHDARTGDLLNEPKPIVDINWASGVDMKTGRPMKLDDAQYWLKGEGGAVVSPSPMGAHNWMPMSFSPQSGLVYIPVSDYPALMTSNPNNLVGFTEVNFYYSKENGGPFSGELLAWDPIKQRPQWRRKIGRPYQGGVLTTAGNIVLQGSTKGTLNAYEARTGELLWSFSTISGVLGAPSTAIVDGVQMIFVAAGSGSTSAVSFAPDFSDRADGPARLLAFSLHGNARLPKPSLEATPIERPSVAEPTPELAESGKRIWDANGCELCHGYRVVGGSGSIPDLSRVPSLPPEAFDAIIRQGVFVQSGMPDFGDYISADEAHALKAYITSEIWRQYKSQEMSAE